MHSRAVIKSDVGVRSMHGSKCKNMTLVFALEVAFSKHTHWTCHFRVFLATDSTSLRFIFFIDFEFSCIALCFYAIIAIKYEPHRDKTNKMACAPSEDSDQPWHPPSLIRVFAVRLKKARILSYPLSAQRRLWSDWADAQADLSLRWAHMPFCWFCHDAAHMSF